MRVLALLLFPVALLLTSTSAGAQPSTTKPGAPQSYPHNLAVPALPLATYSPMPSLPPPQAGEAPAKSNFASGSVLSRPGFRAEILEDGKLVFDSRYLSTGVSNDPTLGPRFRGSFDLTDLFGRDDPYLQEKIELLEETFELRAKQRESHNERVGERALAALPAYLRAVWNHEQWDSTTRRQLLFALWDECAEGGANNAPDGAQARYLIEEFIAQHLPRGGPEGFSREEIRTLNAARTSTLEFAPR